MQTSFVGFVVATCLAASGCSGGSTVATGNDSNPPGGEAPNPELTSQEPVVWEDDPHFIDRTKLPRERGVRIQDRQLDIEIEDAMGTQGSQGMAVKDPQTGEHLWPALVCTNPECPSRDQGLEPFLFVHPIPIKKVDAEGFLVLRKGVKEHQLQPKCPLCSRKDMVEEYVLPASALRRDEIDRELEDARAVYRATGSWPKGMRAPQEIHVERQLLKRVYLPKKYAEGVR